MFLNWLQEEQTVELVKSWLHYKGIIASEEYL